MRKVVLSDSDFAMFDNDIRQEDYDFYQRHRDAFRRMWVEQVRCLLLVCFMVTEGVSKECVSYEIVDSS